MINRVDKDFNEIITNLNSIFIESKLAIIKMSNELLSAMVRIEKENTTTSFDHGHLRDRIQKIQRSAEKSLRMKTNKIQMENICCNSSRPSIRNGRTIFSRN